MKYLIFIFFIVFSINTATVSHLDEKSFLSFTDEHDQYLLIIYENQIQEQSFRNLKIDLDIPILILNKEKDTYITKLYNSLSYPNFICFNSEKTYYYNGPINQNKIKLFISNILNTNIDSIETLEEMKNLMKKHLQKYTILHLGKSSINLNILAQISKNYGINRIYFSHNPDLLEKFHLMKYEYELFLFSDILEEKRMYIQTLDDYSEHELIKYLNIMIRNVYGEVRLLDMNIALGSNPLSTLFFIYGKNDIKSVHMEMKLIAEEYVDELNIVHGSFKNKWMNYILKYFKFKEEDLPILILTKANKHNDDDVEKYYLKFTNSISKDKILNFIKKPSNRVFFSEGDEELKLIGNNFLEVLTEPINEGNEVLLLISSMNSKKHHRINSRMKIVHQILYPVNNNTILIDEIDPILNEVPDINYTELPAIVLLSPENRESWKYINYKGDFTVENIVQFTLKNSRNRLNTQLFEKDNNVLPINPISKYLHQKVFLENNDNYYKSYGLKRMWKYLQMKGKIPTFTNYYKDDYYDSDDEDHDKYDLMEGTKNDL